MAGNSSYINILEWTEMYNVMNNLPDLFSPKILPDHQSWLTEVKLRKNFPDMLLFKILVSLTASL